MNEAVTQAGYDDLLRRDFASFARRASVELNPQTRFLFGWHFEIIAAKLAGLPTARSPAVLLNSSPTSEEVCCALTRNKRSGSFDVSNS
jgi:hypothetical protein